MASSNMSTEWYQSQAGLVFVVHAVQMRYHSRYFCQKALKKQLEFNVLFCLSCTYDMYYKCNGNVTVTLANQDVARRYGKQRPCMCHMVLFFLYCAHNRTFIFDIISYVRRNILIDLGTKYRFFILFCCCFLLTKQRF